MSTVIDERIVEMQFNNKQFEVGIQDTLKSLDSLKNGLNRISDRDLNLDGISDGVDTIASRFTNLGIIGMEVLRNIANRAVDTGIAISRSLSIEPLIGGFREYETKLNAIQTIMVNTANKGTTIEEVTAALDELNEYADMTIYSFSKMTENIGRFTAAGVGLEDSVAAIKGISNLAAGAGSSTNQAAAAMYNLSQSIAAGGLMLQDWNSVVNAGMGGPYFQNAILDAAYAMGELDKATYNLVKTGEISFRSLISGPDRWVASSEVLLQALSKAANDELLVMAATQVKTLTQMKDTVKESIESGWAESWEYIIGDKDAATELWTNVMNGIQNALEPMEQARNTMLKFWSENGGREYVIQGLSNVFSGLASILKPINEAFRNIFPKITGQRIVEISEAFKNLTARIAISSETADKLRNVFNGLFSAVRLVLDIFGFLWDVLKRLVKAVIPFTGGILDLASAIGEFISKVYQSIDASEIFENAYNYIDEVVTKISEKVRTFIKTIADRINEFADINLDPVRNFTKELDISFAPFAFIANTFNTMVNAVKKVFDFLSPYLRKMADAIGKSLKAIGGGLASTFSELGIEGVFGLLTKILTGGLLLSVRGFFKSLTGITDEAQGFLGNIVGILESVKNALNAFALELKSEALKNVAVAIAILAASLLVLATIPADKMEIALAGITILFGELSAMLLALTKGLGAVKLGALSLQMIALSAAILILSAAFKSISKLDWEQIEKGLTGLTAIFAMLIAYGTAMSKVTTRIFRGSTGLLVLSAAVLVLVQSVEALGMLNWDELARGLVGVTVVLAELALFLKITESMKSGVIKSVGLIALATAVRILAESVKEFALLNVEQITKGLVAIGGLLADLAIFTALTRDASHVIATGVGLIALSSAMLVLADAMGEFGSLSWDQIARGLVVMAGALAEITIALNLLPSGMINKATGLIGIATALTIMVKPLRDMGNMTWENIAKGLVTLAGSLTVLAVSLNVMKGALPGAAAMLIVSPALLALAGVLKILGTMNLSEIAKSLGALAGTFAVLGASAVILRPLAPTLLLISAAVAVLGIGVALIGAGILALATGLTTIAAAGTAVAGSIYIVGEAALSLIPMFFRKIGEGIVEIATAIKNGAPALAEAFIALISAALSIIKDIIPEIVDTMASLLDEILSTIDDKMPGLMDKLFSIVIKFLRKLADNMPELIQEAVRVVAAFLDGLFSALNAYKPENMFTLIESISALVSAFALLALAKKSAKDGLKTVGYMAAALALIILEMVVISALDLEHALVVTQGMSVVLVALAATEKVLSTIPVSGAIKAVEALAIFVGGLALLLTALGAIAQIPGITWLVEEGGKVLSAIGTAIGSFVGSIIGGFLEKVSDSFPSIATNLSMFMENLKPFLEGASKIDSKMLEGVGQLVGIIMALTVAGVIEGLTSWFTGGSSIVRFGKDLAEFAPYFKSYADIIKGIDPNVVIASANAAKSLAEFAQNVPNKGGVVSWFTGDNDLSDFAEELEAFGPALKNYGQSIKGLDTQIVQNSANAGLTLAEMAKTLPNKGGVVSWFAGDNSLKDFGEELKAFGPELMQYAESVKNLDTGVVQNSANGAKTLSEMAKNLPNQGGVASWFAGENKISDFGAELIKFGPQIMEYAESVKGLDVSVVSSTANAAKALSEFAANVPNQGGVVAWFTGDNKISSFGVELEKFGPHFKTYADSIKSINPEVVEASANAAKSLGELAKNLPNQGGIGSWFSGDNKISDFGKELTKFGTEFAKYADTVKDINVNAVKGVADSLKILVETAKNIKDAKVSSMKTFSKDLKSLGDSGITAFIKAFKDAHKEATEAINSLISATATAAIAGKKPLVDAMSSVLNEALMPFKNESANAATSTYMSSLANGINSNRATVITAMESVINNMISRVNVGFLTAKDSFTRSMGSIAESMLSKVSDFKNVGEQFANGLISGLTMKAQAVRDAAAKLAQIALQSVNKALGINSPSKEMEEAGRWFDLGFAYGIDKYSDSIISGVADTGAGAVKAMEEAIKQINDDALLNMELTPTIRPVIDLTDINAGLNYAFNQVRPLNVDSIRANAAEVTASRGVEAGTNTNGSQTLDNSQNGINLYNNFYVRNDSDIQKVSIGLNNLLSRYSRSKGVPVTV